MRRSVEVDAVVDVTTPRAHARTRARTLARTHARTPRSDAATQTLLFPQELAPLVFAAMAQSTAAVFGSCTPTGSGSELRSTTFSFDPQDAHASTVRGVGGERGGASPACRSCHTLSPRPLPSPLAAPTLASTAPLRRE